MRILAGLILFALLAGAQEDDYDEFGFPITFDADVITLNDVVRSAGVDSVEAIGSMLGDLEFGEAGREVVIEEFVDAEELSEISMKMRCEVADGMANARVTISAWPPFS